MFDSERLWQTEGLFSDYYLRTRIKDQKSEWWPKDDEIIEQWRSISNLYNKGSKYLGGKNEALCRQELIHPILEQLGFALIYNQKLPEENTEADAILFASQAEKEAVLDKDRDSQYSASVTLLEAKSFKHPLSQISKSQQRYPHQQIRDYLQSSQVLRWGILTNGHSWRLYFRDTKPKDYFEIDLEVAIQSADNFKVFISLFSPVAFRRDTQGNCRLDQIRNQALSSQSELEQNIRKRVFTILETLANGFAKREENQIEKSEANYKILYENCLIYLYRLLFILYAEGRSLLPVESPQRKYYKKLSLARLKSSLRDFSLYEDQHLTDLCDSIQYLFHLINGTNKRMNDDYGVPQYNGGLFNPDTYPHLEQWKISNADLSEVLRGLLFNPPPDRDKPTLPIETVDFGDLRVQQLGSIYEGLLEFHLVKSEDESLILQPDKAERKATGTYYTPDYIVKYIIEQTLKPLVDEIANNEAVKSKKPDSFAEAILNLNVCDPAMGSGHFLVEATTFLAEQIVTHPTTSLHTKESKDEEEIAYWRRRVVESCIYGVDLNPLAVELAKLSLWLTCIAVKEPLNFLDHHLRVGNSLIGASINQLGSLPDVKGKKNLEKQTDLFFKADLQKEIAATIEGIKQIERDSSESVEAVKSKEKRWAEDIMPRLAPYKHIADLWTGAFFGEMTDKQAYIDSVQKILKKPQKKYPEHERRFFHWELEFPAVFFNEDGSPKDNPGFDAVVGNPPWGFTSDKGDQNYYSGKYYVSKCTFDSFALMSELALEILMNSHYMGFIIPNGWQTGKSYAVYRKYLIDKSLLINIINLPYNVFPDAYVDAMILINEKYSAIARSSVNILNYKIREKLEEISLKDPRRFSIDYSLWFSSEIDPIKDYQFLSYLTPNQHYCPVPSRINTIG